jgi:hypothetical protein
MPSADAHKEQLRRALVHLLRQNLPQYIRQAVASQNHPTISYTTNSGETRNQETLPVFSTMTPELMRLPTLPWFLRTNWSKANRLPLD